jgi:excisionase family DNA binding protein
MTTSPSKDKWIKVAEVATIFEVSRVTVYSWIKQRKLPEPVDLGDTRWNREQFNEWLHGKYGGAIHA